MSYPRWMSTPEPKIPAQWREERAYRIGTAVSRAVIVLAIVTGILNLTFATWLEVAADLFVIIGCSLGLYLTRKNLPERRFVWWPFAVGFVISTVPSTWMGGGIYSPWIAYYFSCLLILGSVMQTRFRTRTIFAATMVYALAWVAVGHFYPYPDPIGYVQHFPPTFMICAAAIFLGGLSYALSAYARTERDLSKELKAQYATLLKEETASQAKSAFLANISHELRTPLGAILGYAQLLREGEVSASERTRFLDTIERNAQQLAHLVDDLLDLSKAEAGRIEVEKLEADLPTLFSEVIQLLEINARKKQLRLSLAFATPIPERAVTDPHRLKQILTNVIGNAIKFTEAGSVQVSASFDSGVLTVRVRDTGRGISFDERDKLFKPFSQADASMTRRYGGTGLGLKFSQELAHLLGGDLELTWAELGRGSEFTLTLPLELRGAPSFVSAGSDLPSRTERSKNYDFRGRNILIVDDSPDNRDMLHRYLSATGAQIDEASDGLEALEKFERRDYDAVLMDIQMPRLDGLQATSMLRRRHVNTHVVAVTAHAMERDRQRCIEAGCDDHLAKPVARNELLSTLERHLGPPEHTPGLTSVH